MPDHTIEALGLLDMAMVLIACGFVLLVQICWNSEGDDQ